MLPALTYAITLLLGAGEECAVPEGLRDERAGFKPSLSVYQKAEHLTEMDRGWL